jgi:hypothetical protein
MGRRPVWTLDTVKRRKPVTLTVNRVFDIGPFAGTPVFPYLLMAANPQMSRRDIHAVLARLGGPNVRSLGWIQRRVWMLTGDTHENDGTKWARLRRLIEENPSASAGQLAAAMRREGFKMRALDVKKRRAHTS